MAEITQEISPSPPGISRSNQETFAAGADDWVEYMEDIPLEYNTLASQINTVSGEINTNANISVSAKDIILATANATVYDSGTPYDASEVVYDPANEYIAYTSQQDSNANHTPSSDDGTWWIKTLNIDDRYKDNNSYLVGNIVSDPSDNYELYTSQQDDNINHTPSADDGTWWKPVMSKDKLAGGTNDVISAIDITLTNISTKVQNIAMTDFGKYVILPDATTLSEGFLYIFYNNGANDFIIKNSDSTIVERIATRQCYIVTLLDNSTAAGSWGIHGFTTGGLTLSDAEVFESATLSYSSVVKLTETKLLVAYADGGNASFGTACILDISEDSIIAGTPSVFESAHANFIVASRLTDTQVMVFYVDYGNSNYPTACVLDISGSTITAGTPLTVANVDSDYTCGVGIEDTKAVFIYRNNASSGRPTSRILNVSGSTITAESSTEIETGVAAYISTAKITSAKVIVSYSGGGGHGKSCILDISVNTITPATPVAFNPANSQWTSTAVINESIAVVGYHHNSGTKSCSVCLLNISGSVITPETPLVVENGEVGSLGLASLSESKLIIAYQNVTDSNYGKICELNIANGSLILNDPIEFNSGTTGYVSVAGIIGYKGILTYQDGGNSNYGTTKLVFV